MEGERNVKQDYGKTCQAQSLCSTSSQPVEFFFSNSKHLFTPHNVHDIAPFMQNLCLTALHTASLIHQSAAAL